MQDLLSFGRSGLDLLLVIVGFGLIIFVHELGHFAAAKWAGIRVLAFAIGFGPAAVSYRKGLGWRRGSSERDYLALVNAEAAGATTIEGNRSTYHRISPTEYRLNWLPLGGYVKMLGQDDLDPRAVSAERDSYQNTPVWKRMVVISAGVVMNVLLAALLFIAVFMTGLRTEPPKIGAVVPGMPAALAGLKAGDTVLEVNGRTAREFTDLIMASAMSGRSDAVELVVQRPGEEAARKFEVRPRVGRGSKLLEMGIEPARSNRLLSARTEAEREMFRTSAAAVGLEGLEPGMRLVRAGDREVKNAADLQEVVRASDGKPVPVVFEDDAGKRVSLTLKPRPVLQIGWVPGLATPTPHLLGLVPVMSVAPGAKEDGKPPDRQGLQDNDVFARLGTLEFPGVPQGIDEVHKNRGRAIGVAVLRKDGAGEYRYVEVEPRPTVKKVGEGQIGFIADSCADFATFAAVPVPLADVSDGDARPMPAASLITRPGMRIVAVAGKPVKDFAELRLALRDSTDEALRAGAASATVPVQVELPLWGTGETRPVETVAWTLAADDIRGLRDLGWTTPIDLGIFEPEEITLQAEGPLDAIRMGLHKTQRVMTMTYLTFQRLFEGTVRVEHLKGPVGIAHMGTKIADRGLIWLLFFMGLISVNLAVINFLPLPIVDGGQFVFLILEQVRGKPVSVEVQNVATVLGLVLIGAVFVIVTFNDITGLFAG